MPLFLIPFAGPIISGLGTLLTSAGTTTIATGTLAGTAATIAKGIKTTTAARTIGALAANGVAESFIDNVLRDKVAEPAIGSMVYCDLFHAEHTGIYIGNGTIVHLDGNGKVKAVGADSFLDRMDGLNTAISIYVSCNGADPVGCSEAARRARAKVNQRTDYNLLMNNCHQFTAGCLTGEFENGYNFFSLLKPLAEDQLDADTWRVWDV